MPPVDRNEPVRANYSESSYSLMEFMREFPNDAACPDWLAMKLRGHSRALLLKTGERA